VQVGFPRERILVQPRGVDRELFAYHPPRTRAPGEALRILSIRWLKPLYRVDTLVEAFSELHRRGMAFEARIGGEGSERARLEDRVREAGLASEVRFVGAIDADRVPDQMRWADVYVSTSSSDGASSSLFEALSIGACPVVSDIEANRPFVEPGITGELFPVGNAEALAACLAELARDEARRHALIVAARDFVAEHLDYEKNMARIDGFLAERARGF